MLTTSACWACLCAGLVGHQVRRAECAGGGIHLPAPPQRTRGERWNPCAQERCAHTRRVPRRVAAGAIICAGEGDALRGLAVARACRQGRRRQGDGPDADVQLPREGVPGTALAAIELSVRPNVCLACSAHVPGSHSLAGNVADHRARAHRAGRRGDVQRGEDVPRGRGDRRDAGGGGVRERAGA
eukprot:scaffold156_cov308-Prasinococcus_capsulatus_cf.AAC.7